jgi:hypothetical protein
MGELVFDGYVKDAETTLGIEGANVSYTQGLTNTIVTDSEGYYITTSSTFITGYTTAINVSASGHGTYWHTFTPLVSGVIRINMTLISLSPGYEGIAIAGVVRNPPYNRTIDNATINIYNIYEGGPNYTVISNSAGFYLNNNTDIIAEGREYNVWGNKSGYANSTVYNITVFGTGPA